VSLIGSCQPSDRAANCTSTAISSIALELTLGLVPVPSDALTDSIRQVTQRADRRRERLSEHV
jgi:hypothetical protein